MGMKNLAPGVEDFRLGMGGKSASPIGTVGDQENEVERGRSHPTDSRRGKGEPRRVSRRS